MNLKVWLFAFVGSTSLLGQVPKVSLPDETAGIDAIARTLVAAFDHVDIVALGEMHGQKLDSDLRIAVVRHPDFAKNVRSIVVEFGSASEQSTLDRDIRGENVSRDQLEQVWKTTEGAASGVWDSPIIRVSSPPSAMSIRNCRRTPESACSLGTRVRKGATAAATTSLSPS